MRHRAQRWPCRIPVSLQLPSGTGKAILVNVSEKGARLADVTGGTTVAGDCVSLVAAGHRLKAAVRWTSQNWIAIQFETPLTRPMLARLRLHGGGIMPAAAHAARAAPGNAIRAAVSGLTSQNRP